MGCASMMMKVVRDACLIMNKGYARVDLVC